MPYLRLGSPERRNPALVRDDRSARASGLRAHGDDGDCHHGSSKQNAACRVGYVIPGCEAKLGEGDELLVRGPNIFPGYWKREEATANAFLDGWFRTGDQVELDEGGNLRVIGRVGNVLVPESGHNVAPEPIEQALLDHMPKAEHAVVVGHGRPYLTAIVTGKVAREDVAQAVEQVNASLPHYRRIRAFHLALEPLTIESGLLTANQKLRRRAIETHFKDALKELYT